MRNVQKNPLAMLIVAAIGVLLLLSVAAVLMRGRLGLEGAPPTVSVAPQVTPPLTR